MIQYRETNACDLNKKLLAQPNTETSSENWKIKLSVGAAASHRKY
jgi:hypothetical protein